MDVTSHSITLISIIVGLGLTELLLNLHRLIHAGDRCGGTRSPSCGRRLCC